MNAAPASFGHAVKVTIQREWLSHRVNRFLYWHLALVTVAGILAVFASPEDEERGVAWFILYTVMYAVSLSSVLLGLSSAQAERDEIAFLQTQPTGTNAWVLGKAAGLTAIVAPSAVLLVAPWVIASEASSVLLNVALSSAAVCVLLALLGLAIGLWVSEPVRALITAIGLWLALLFVTDLLLLLVAGSPWIQSHPSAWVGVLMLNPLDAFRVSVLFTVERAVFNTLGAGPLVAWWTNHPGLWLACCTGGWSAIILGLGLRAARPSCE